MKIAHLTLKPGEVYSCLVRSETPKHYEVSILRVYNSMFDYSSGVPKIISKHKIIKTEWKS